MKMLVLLALVAVPAHAEIVRDMTPERVREAIATGSASKDYPAYRLKGGGFELGRGRARVALLTTPYSRVAAKAYAAKREYRAVDSTTIEAGLLEPYIEVYAPADKVQPSKWTRASVTGVRKIVVTGPKGSSPVHPLEATPETARYGNALGGQWEAQSLTARFPLDVLRADAEVHVLYEDGKDATFRFDLKDVR